MMPRTYVPDQVLKARILALAEEDLPEPMRGLKGRYPERLDEFFQSIGLDPQKLAGDSRNVTDDIYKVLGVAVAFDVRDRSRKWVMTRKTWAVLEAAKNASGEAGLKQAMTGMHEILDMDAKRFPLLVETAYSSLKKA